MKKVRIAMLMSGAALAVLGPREMAAVSQTAVVPLGPGVRPVSIQCIQNLPALDSRNLESIKATAQQGRREQIGVGRVFENAIVISRATVPISQWTVLPNGWSIWSVEVGSEGALGLRIHIESLHLPRGARIVVYDPANPQPDASPVTTQTLAGRRDVWTATLFSERAIVECQVPPGVNPLEVSFMISGVSHLFALPLQGPAPMEGSCHNDVTCYPEYAQQASGVARMAFVQGGNAFTCSGCLLQANDPTQPYFLTAQHCIYDQTIAATIELYWFYQTSVCNGPRPALSSAVHTGGGAELLATSNANDFSFMRLNQQPPSGAIPLAWSTSPPSGSQTLACIHHPTGAYKRISFGNEIGATANFWGVQWSSGATESGSSGSPLLNASHEVIGQLNAGFNGGPGSSCTELTVPDQFGRFDVTYPAIQQWLGASGPPPTPTFAKGTYNGLIIDDQNGPSLQTSGSFAVTTTVQGRFTARFLLGPVRYSVVGQLGPDGSAQFNIPHRSLGGQLQVDPNDADHITGTLSDGSFTAQLDGDRAVFDGRNNPAAEAGQYTLVIPNGGDPANSPGGDSYGTVVVDRLGHVRLAAALADGSRMSQSGTLSKNGRWPLYAPLYGSHGFMLSWVTFSSEDGSDFSGMVTWARPASAFARLYPAGFSVQATINGSAYARPAPQNPILNLSDASLQFIGGDLSSDLTDSIAIAANSRVTNLSGNRLALSFSIGNGMFHGTVIPPDSKRPIAFNGVVFQKQNTANGYFLGSSTSGNVFLGPP